MKLHNVMLKNAFSVLVPPRGTTNILSYPVLITLLITSFFGYTQCFGATTYGATIVFNAAGITGGTAVAACQNWLAYQSAHGKDFGRFVGTTLISPPFSGYCDTDIWPNGAIAFGATASCPEGGGFDGLSNCVNAPNCSPSSSLRDFPTGQCFAPTCPTGSLFCTQSGPSCPDPSTLKPITIGTGNKYLPETDLVISAITLQRSFNTANTGAPFDALITSGKSAPNPAGSGWTFDYQQRIRLPFATATVAWTIRPSGRIYTFSLSGSTWTSDADVQDRLTELRDGSGVRTGWHYYAAESEQLETYDANGILQSIANKDGTTQPLIYSDGTDGVASGKGG
ncbi:MAG TPA: DUF6531 domain-containing protein, partial [Rhodocyclaceae bacterium]|nr:DUF6531 domain-containing protein [Rhodocyclaceae bacterium]